MIGKTLLAALSLICLPTASPAEALIERYVEVRTVLGFRITQAAAQSLVPQGWEATPAELTGGINQNLILTERLLHETPDGKIINGGRSRAAIFVVPAKASAGNGSGPLIGLVLAPPPENVPGVYGTAIRSEVDMTRLRQFGGDGDTGAEKWIASTPDGDRLQFELTYTPGFPARHTTVANVYSGRNAGFYQVYQIDQGVDLLRSPGATDRVQSLLFQASGPRFARIFDVDTAIISVAVVPWHLRNVSLP
jgi:hypothetical protein